MSGLFAGTSLERPVTCEVCEQPLDDCGCPRDRDGVVQRPKDQRVTVRREKRKGGRAVTVAFGFAPGASDLAGILGELRGTLATGGTAEDDRFELRGDHVAAVSDHLKKLGYDVRG